MNVRSSAAFVIALVAVAVAPAAHAYDSAPSTPEYRAFLARVRNAGARTDVRAITRLAGREFTVGEELDRTASIGELRARRGWARALVRLLDRGGCYQTGRSLVQCELPDPGPQLDHTRGTGEGTLAIFERENGRWHINVLAWPR